MFLILHVEANSGCVGNGLGDVRIQNVFILQIGHFETREGLISSVMGSCLSGSCWSLSVSEDEGQPIQISLHLRLHSCLLASMAFSNRLNDYGEISFQMALQGSAMQALRT